MERLLGVVLAILGAINIIVSASFTTEFMARGAELHKSCPLSPEICPFTVTPWQGVFLILTGIAMVAMGAYLFKMPMKAEVARPVLDSRKIEETLKNLEGDEKTVYEILSSENGMMFQSKLVERTGFTKVKVSRVLDSMEAKGLLERKRRGMTNVVVFR